MLWSTGRRRAALFVALAAMIASGIVVAVVRNDAGRPPVDALPTLPTLSPGATPTLTIAPSTTPSGSPSVVPVTPRTSSPGSAFQVRPQGVNVWSSLSGDGRLVAFESNAALLPVKGTWTQVYVYDAVTKRFELVSVSTKGASGNHYSGQPSISDNGRYVVFNSLAANLVPGDTNGKMDVFVRDRVARTTKRVSVRTDGRQPNAGSSLGPHALSSSGRTVVFTSSASDLVPGDTNGKTDVFVKDMVAGAIALVSKPASGTANGNSKAGVISADGGVVAFESQADNIVPGDAPPQPTEYEQVNAGRDVFVFDRSSGAIERVPLPPAVADNENTPENYDVQDFTDRPSLSPDGRYLAFRANVGRHQERWRALYMLDREADDTDMIAVVCDNAPMSYEYMLCGQGDVSFASRARLMAFSTQSNPVGTQFAGEGGVFVRDMPGSAVRTFRVSLDPQGKNLGWTAFRPSLSADGTTVAFDAYGRVHESNKCAGYGNEVADPVESCVYLYVRDVQPGTTRRIT